MSKMFASSPVGLSACNSRKAGSKENSVTEWGRGRGGGGREQSLCKCQQEKCEWKNTSADSANSMHTSKPSYIYIWNQQKTKNHSATIIAMYVRVCVCVAVCLCDCGLQLSNVSNQYCACTSYKTTSKRHIRHFTLSRLLTSSIERKYEQRQL